MAKPEAKRKPARIRIVKAYGREFVLAFEPKIHRAIYGNEKGGGVGIDASDEALLAEYDRLGGLITMNGKKVKTGTFYDFRKAEPIEKPELAFAKKPKAKTDTIEKAGDADEVDEDEEEDEEAAESESDEEESEEEDEEADGDEDEEEETPAPAKPAKKK